MKHLSLILCTGFALFSMFFGSGNLVFPLLVGQESNGHILLASLGLFLTAVLVPFLGIFAMMLFKGKTEDFFGTLGKYSPFCLSLLMLSLMGPFGVLPRCITVAHGSFRLLFPDASLIYFSLASCAAIFWVALNKDKLVNLLGSILTPFLLVALALITLFGFWHSELPAPQSGQEWQALQLGIFQGYQTMDLLAAFFFSAFIIRYLEQRIPVEDKHNLWKIFFQAALVGAGMLTAVYFALVHLGSSYGLELKGVPAQAMLGVIAQHSLGSFSAPIVCVTIILACFTTGVVLARLFADFLRQSITQNKISQPWALLATLMIAFAVSTLEFSGIARWLGPILETLYPAFIVMTLLNIGMTLWGMKQRRWPVVLVVLAKLSWI